MATENPKIKLLDRKVNFRKGSAREAYYNLLKAHNGKTLESFVKAAEKAPPSMPARGKLKGKPEPIRGGISWFTRNGDAEIKEANWGGPFGPPHFLTEGEAHVEIIFVLERTTKGAVRYTEVDPQGRPATAKRKVGTLYFRKSSWPDGQYPETIRVAVEPTELR